jgi:hypothetical protein
LDDFAVRHSPDVDVVDLDEDVALLQTTVLDVFFLFVVDAAAELS